MDVSEEFKRLCVENKVFPPDYISRQLENITRDPGGGLLRLQSDSIPLPVYHALSHLIARTEAVTLLDLADCCLTSDTINILLQGVMRNNSIKALCMSGNNMTGSCVVTLGDLLRVNTSITKLFLEWNCVGHDQEAFSQLCSGLAANTSLEFLDLRNNQLSANNAVILCHALTVNTQLRELDLRWNNLGPSGGQKFTELLQSNVNIVKLELQGNHLGKEFLHSIECLVNRNIDNKHLKRNKVSRSAMSTPEKHQSMKNCNGNNYSVYMNGSCDNLNSNKYYEHQDRSLKFLEKHKVVLLDLSSKLDKTQSSLKAAQEKVVELQEILTTKEEMIEDLLMAVKEKDQKIRKVEQEHVQIQNDLIIKNMKLLQEREETFKSLTNRNKQIDEYKLNINEMTMKLEKLKHEIMFNEDKLFEENEMLKGKIKQENINYNLKLDSLQTEKESLFHENDNLKRIIEEKDVNLNILLKQEAEKYKTLKEEKCEMEESLNKLSLDFKDLLLCNESLNGDLLKSEENAVKISEKIKNQSMRHREDINKLELKITKVQKENCLKSHKISFLLEKIQSDCETWNKIESSLKNEISNLNAILGEKENLLSQKDETIAKIRSAENDRAASLLEAVRSYVGENNFKNLNKENGNLTTSMTRSMIRTVSTINLKNGFAETNNNQEESREEEVENCFESNDTDLSQNSFNSSENVE